MVQKKNDERMGYDRDGLIFCQHTISDQIIAQSERKEISLTKRGVPVGFLGGMVSGRDSSFF